ncbi:MAG: hypothetical protein K6U03_04720 [Firmicutes bacterium]|nr:hypothetical protein [Bacillota bacterium]
MQRFRRFGAFLVLAVTVLWLLRRYFYMTDLPFLGGADAYYYAMQVKNLVATGALKIPDFSPLYGLLWLTVRLGLTCTQAVVLWTLLIQLLIGINLVLARRMLQAGKGVRLGPLLLCCWALASPTLAFTCLEFPKYAFALAFVPLWLPGLVEKK